MTLLSSKILLKLIKTSELSDTSIQLVENMGKLGYYFAAKAIDMRAYLHHAKWSDRGST